MDNWGETIAAAGFVAIHVAHIKMPPTEHGALCDAVNLSQDECNLDTFKLPGL